MCHDITIKVLIRMKDHQLWTFPFPFVRVSVNINLKRTSELKLMKQVIRFFDPTPCSISIYFDNCKMENFFKQNIT